MPKLDAWGPTDRQTDRETDRQRDRQTKICIYRASMELKIADKTKGL